MERTSHGFRPHGSRRDRCGPYTRKCIPSLSVSADLSDILAGPRESCLEDLHTRTRTEHVQDLYSHTCCRAEACPRLTQRRWRKHNRVCEAQWVSALGFHAFLLLGVKPLHPKHKLRYHPNSPQCFHQSEREIEPFEREKFTETLKSRGQLSHRSAPYLLTFSLMSMTHPHQEQKTRKATQSLTHQNCERPADTFLVASRREVSPLRSEVGAAPGPTCSSAPGPSAGEP